MENTEISVFKSVKSNQYIFLWFLKAGLQRFWHIKTFSCHGATTQMNFAGFTPMDCAGFTQKELRCQDKKAARAWGQILGLEEEMQGLPLPHLPLPHCVTLESSFPLPALHLPTQTSPALSWVVLYARAKLATLPRGNVIWPTQKGIHSAQELACALSTTESTFIATAPPAKPWPAATILTKLHCTDQA